MSIQRIGSSRNHLRQKAPVSWHPLTDRQTQLHFPAARGHRMDDRHTQVLLQEVDYRQDTPAGAEKIDGLCLAVFEKCLFDMSVDLLGRKVTDFVEGHR